MDTRAPAFTAWLSDFREEPFRYPASEAAANMRVIEALNRSARSDGRPEAV
jgi:hypothetical protein